LWRSRSPYGILLVVPSGDVRRTARDARIRGE
jgi:hypothetical protein